MAQRVQVVLVDDIDGGEATETVSFALDGVSYEVDLSAENAAAMRESLASYVGVARKVGGRSTSGRAASSSRGGGTNRRGGGGGGAARSSGNTAEIREWARANGYQVNERGRISAAVLEAYEKAHS